MSRSLPDVRDGLKPVHRRLLYAMRELKLDPAAGFKKCARIVGDVMGKFHPHGDQAIYDALVRLAQEFAQRYPLVDGQGNFGNVDGDNAAAMRYTEARLTAVAQALLAGIDEDTVDFRPIPMTARRTSRMVLPAETSRTCWPTAPPASPSAWRPTFRRTTSARLCDALLHLIKTPTRRCDKLVQFIPGPDLPTGGVIVEPRENILRPTSTGRGGFRVARKMGGGGTASAAPTRSSSPRSPIRCRRRARREDRRAAAGEEAAAAGRRARRVGRGRPPRAGAALRKRRGRKC